VNDMNSSRNSWWAGGILSALIVASVLTALLAMPQNNDQAEMLLQAAIHKEMVDGELEQAIDLYRKIVGTYSGNRPVAAKALLQMGHCYEKLGKEGARSAYERLVRDYADQNEVAAQARTRLAALRKPAVRESGMATRQVWTGPDIDFEGAPSPDGRYLSFVDWDTGDLAIRDLESGTNRRLTNKGSWEKSDEFAEFSRWSPDGRQIAYDWYDGKCCVDLRVIALEGGKSRVLIDYENDEWMQTYDWSPDGRQILTFLETKDGTRQIVLVSAADGATKVLKTFEGRGDWPHTMRFSRDGQYVAYDFAQEEEENAPEHDIFLISVDGKNEVPLVKHPAHDFLLGWPPNEKGILFASERTGSLDMWFLPVSAGKVQSSPELVQRGVERIVPMGFTQNGSFFYAQDPAMHDIYVAKMDRQSGKILAPPEKAIKRFEGANSWPEYSPDGKHLVYVRARTRRSSTLCLRSLETGKEREFSTKFRRLSSPRWSPDGQFIYLAATDAQGEGIYRVNAQTGEFTPIMEPPASLYAHEVSLDGKALICGRQDRQREVSEILRRDLATGDEKQLYAGPFPDRFMISLSPDGRWLAFMDTSKKRALRVMPASGGEPRELLRFEEIRIFNYFPIEWTADGKYILFPRVHPAKDKPGFALWRIAADGGEPQETGLVMASFMKLSAHPDGQHLAFDSRGFTQTYPAVWVMENFLPPASGSK
jgi:Tol biopolymer transport system component